MSLQRGHKTFTIRTPNLQTVYKWQGVLQVEKAIACEDDNEGFYMNDERDTAYLVEEQSNFEGKVQGIRVETIGAQARGKLLSVLLRHIDGQKMEGLKRNAYDEESPSQLKRMRMNDILGIVRNDANAAKASQNVGASMTPAVQQCIKRIRSLNDDFEDGLTKPTRKRLRLYQQIQEIPDDEEEYITAFVAERKRQATKVT